MVFPVPRLSTFRASFGLVLSGLAACGGCGKEEGPSGPSPTMGFIQVAPSAAALEPGQVQSFVAACLGTDGKPFPCPALTWAVAGGTRQSVSGAADTAGVFTAGGVTGTFTLEARTPELSSAATVVILPAGSGPTVTVVPGVTYQTMTGWEAVAKIGQDDPEFCDAGIVATYRDAAADRAVDELGLDRLRLELKSGSENPRDGFAELLAGTIEGSEWRTFRFAAVNDNSDPSSVNAAGYHFTEIDHAIDNVVTPVRDRLLARGEALYINLTYVDFSGQGAGSLFHKDAPAEYAELLLTAFQHIQSRYGWVPDAVEMVLEPDNASWSGTQIGRAMVAAGDRLAAAGYRPDFIAPSNTNMGRAISWFDELVAVPRATQYLTDLAYHRYGGVSDANLQAINARAVAFGIRTSMLEHIGSGYQDLHKDLTLGRNSSWEQFTLAWCNGNNDNGAQYFPVDISSPSAPVVLTGSRTKFLQQYFRHVRLGAVRHEAISSATSLEPLAFRNPDGRWTVVVMANAGEVFSVEGLPAGTYDLTYTTAAQYRTALPPATISTGQPVIANIPTTGVLTVSAR